MCYIVDLKQEPCYLVRWMNTLPMTTIVRVPCQKGRYLSALLSLPTTLECLGNDVTTMLTHRRQIQRSVETLASLRRTFSVGSLVPHSYPYWERWRTAVGVSSSKFGPTKKSNKASCAVDLIGRGTWIRTADLTIPKPATWQCACYVVTPFTNIYRGSQPVTIASLYA